MSDGMYFGKLQNLFFQHYNKGEYQQALAFLEQNAPQVPDHGAMLSAWIAGMYCRCGDGTNGLHVLEEAYAAGYWYHEEGLANDPDYEILREDPAFQDLLKRFQKRRIQDGASLRPHLVVLEPPLETPQPWPLLIALHGNGSSMESFAPHFRCAAALGWLVAVPQSHDASWVSGHYDWQNYEEACFHLQNEFDLLKNRCEVDPERIVLAGYSMGGKIGVQAALKGDIPARGFIGIEGWIFEDDLLPPLLETTTRRDLRFYLITGNDAQFCEGTRQAQERLAAAGFACEVEKTSNDYHRVPENFDAILPRALNYICG